MMATDTVVLLGSFLRYSIIINNTQEDTHQHKELSLGFNHKYFQGYYSIGNRDEFEINGY
ncbi:MAG: hypothetical protein COB01_06380 [Lutibacter sp.]|nr:MAG: hypothetical protein COB01_06380 [Lutibacter sp.]